MAFEFRHESWLDDEVYRLLSGHGSTALVVSDRAGVDEPPDGPINVAGGSAISVNGLLALIGERGREVRDFLEKDLKAEGLGRSVVVVATVVAASTVVSGATVSSARRRPIDTG